MPSNKLSYRGGCIQLAYSEEKTLRLTPQQCWELSEQARDLVFTHWSEFEQKPRFSVEVRGSEFFVIPTKNAGFWRGVARGAWEPTTFDLLKRMLTPEMVYLDVGAWIGPTVLFAAQHAGQVIAFEPDPVAFKELQANLDANAQSEWASHVSLHEAALSHNQGTARLSNSSRAGDSTSSLLGETGNSTWEVRLIALASLLETYQLHDKRLFIKMDIEGGEYQLLPSLEGLLRSLDVTLLLSLHPKQLREQIAATSSAGAFMQRLSLVRTHQELFSSLPFPFLYSTDGGRFSPFQELFQIFRKSKGTREFLCSKGELKL